MNIKNLSEMEQREILALAEELEQAKRREKVSGDFMEFVKMMWPAFIEGRHHKIIAEAFARIVDGDQKRLIVAMPPRHTKSEFASHLLPAWFLGKYPDKKVIQTSHTAELAVGFGRKVRNLVSSEEYKIAFPGVRLAADAKAAGRWVTNKSGEYFAIGVGGAVVGRGADLLIIDDPHSEQEAALNDPRVYDRVYEWYTSGPRQRLQPGGRIILVATRWHKRDLAGQILKMSIERGNDEWELIEFPALLPSGNAVWPEFWSKEALENVKSELPVSKWNAQYQQNPTSEEGAIIKRDWWKVWDDIDKPPPCSFVIQAWDTAFTKKSTADFSACVTFGVFRNEQTETNDLILLDAIQERMEFPDLKEKALQMYKIYEPDSLIVEAKAAGSPLIDELRRIGVLVHAYTPTRGSRFLANDKITRVNSIADIFRDGRVWVPETRWAEEVIEQCASFPFAEHDDLVDAVSIALMRFREGGFIRLSTDDYDETPFFRKKAKYY